jgi:hypothetical protein
MEMEFTSIQQSFQTSFQQKSWFQQQFKQLSLQPFSSQQQFQQFQQFQKGGR